MVFAEKYLNYRYNEGREKVREAGAMDERARFEIYLGTVEEARLSGQEPPPSPSESDFGQRRL